MRSLSLPSVLLLIACGGGDSAPASSGNSDTTSRATATPSPTPLQQASFDPTSITPAMVAMGDSVFHGKLGGSPCQTCHGVGGKAGPLAPDLTDGEWLHSDGGWEGIYNTVKNGVMAPKQYTGVMPPYGGVPLSEDRTRAVAAYVYSLSKK